MEVILQHINFYNPGSDGHHSDQDNFYLSEEGIPSTSSSVPDPSATTSPAVEPQDYLAHLSSARDTVHLEIPEAEIRLIRDTDKAGMYEYDEHGVLHDVTPGVPKETQKVSNEYLKQLSDAVSDHLEAVDEKVGDKFVLRQPPAHREAIKPLADAFVNLMDEADAENKIARELKSLKDSIFDIEFTDSLGEKHNKNEIVHAIDQVYNSIQKQNISQAEIFLRQIPRGYGIREKVRKITGLQKHQEHTARELLRDAYDQAPAKKAA